VIGLAHPLLRDCAQLLGQLVPYIPDFVKS
jgi:hypothetical protein